MIELNELLELINAGYVVYDENFDIGKLKDKYKIIKDARSAAFYAYGKSIKSNKNVVLIINGDYLPNVYTVLTEAWFQKTNLIVIALYNSIYDVETTYLDRCTVSNITFFDRDYQKFRKKIISSLNLIGPKLFNIVTEIKENRINYSNIINKLGKILKPEDTIFIYNSEIIQLNCKIKNIDKKYKYGLLSKYLGYINTLDKNKQVLICPAECLEIDLNILNNRAMNKKFKAIVTGNIEHLKDWIENNNIKLIISEDIEMLYNSNQATILNLKEE